MAELVVATPTLLLLVLVVIQFALFEHASHVAQAAASEALAAARVQGGSSDAGTTEAQAVLAQLGHSVLVGPQVRVTEDATTVKVTVSGSTEGVLPFVHLQVHATAAGPLERFVARRQAP